MYVLMLSKSRLVSISGIYGKTVRRVNMVRVVDCEMIVGGINIASVGMVVVDMVVAAYAPV